MSNSSACCAFQSPILIQFIPPVLILQFTFGLTLNILALSMFIFHVESWKPNSIYLANLAMADLVEVICLFFRADYYIRGQNWIFGDVPCRMMLFLVSANRAAGIFFLTAVAVDRYLKIVHPLHRLNRMNLSYSVWVSAGLWAMVIVFTGQLLGSPHFFSFGNHTQCESFNICLNVSPLSIWQNAFYVIQFCVPGSIIIFCTVCITWQLKMKTMDSTGKIKKAVQFIVIVAMVFLICFFPSTAIRVAIWILQIWYNECSHFSGANLAFFITVCFTYLNCVLNPLVYYFSTPAFSGVMQKCFRRLMGKKEEEAHGNSTRVTTESE
ncbi:hydroxycarboxylic acid receptor 2-like [Clarias gariepinus]|uniref:hydroxycarboxylic acid receptor 2-like n=1 Tax=Clarias gariepinus TaxID=13013 RepID=UPI00234C72CF|nr:hydroxycarboxylic acid receptor 2-like [Clarias gariepinus]